MLVDCAKVFCDNDLNEQLFPLVVPMTKINLIEKRKKYIEQRINKLKEMQASLNTQERKKRTRRLIELGDLISKAQLQDWDVNTLYGALLSLKEKEADQLQVEVWAYKGGREFGLEKNGKKI